MGRQKNDSVNCSSGPVAHGVFATKQGVGEDGEKEVTEVQN